MIFRDMSSPKQTAARIGGMLLLVVVAAAVMMSVLTRHRLAISMSGSAEYSLRGVIKAHGYSSKDMLGQVPLELPLLLHELYGGRRIVAHDSTLFTQKAVGKQFRVIPSKKPLVVSPAVAATWSSAATRQLVYNPYMYGQGVEVGVPLTRQNWPSLIRLLPPLVPNASSDRVFLVEAEGVLYFAPSEWLTTRLDTALPIINHFKEPLFVAVMWLLGWLFMSWAIGSAWPPTMRWGAALPLGLGCWSLFYWVARCILGRAFVLGNTEVLFGVCSVSIFVVFAAGVWRLPRCARDLFRGLVGAAAVFLVSVVASRVVSFVPTVDSFRLLSYENSPTQSLAEGFPVLFSAVGALGATTLNGFAGSIFPLLYVSLAVVTASFMVRFSCWYPTRRLAHVSAALLLVLLFAVTPMAVLQFSYINAHVFHGACLLILTCMIIMSRCADFTVEHRGRYFFFTFVVGLLASISRIEGTLILCVLLSSVVFARIRAGLPAARLTSAAIALSVVCWSGLTVVILEGSTFVSGKQYAVIGALGALLGLLSALSTRPILSRFLSAYGSCMLLFGCSLLLYAVHVISPDHMGESSASVIHNLFSPTEGWGYFWWWMAASIAGIWYLLTSVRDETECAGGNHQHQVISVLGAFLLVSLAVILAIGLFRVPYRVGWSDSANRIVFQLTPVVLIWLFTAIGVVISRKGTRAESILETKKG